jgi:hypothetical protein
VSVNSKKSVQTAFYVGVEHLRLVMRVRIVDYVRVGLRVSGSPFFGPS